MAEKPPTPHESALLEAQNLMQLWLRTKAYFAKANNEEPISREDEQVFLETKSELSRYQRTLTPKLPQDVSFGAERMQDLLRQSISISHLRNLPKADRAMLMSNWHYVFINLSRAMGSLQFLVEGYQPPFREKKGAGTNLSDLKGAAAHSAKVKKGGMGKTIFKVLAFLAAAGFAAYRVMNS